MRLPPLNALRAFEATARTGSISRAALELCVTHGAVSRQIAKLEHSVGARLFDRNGPKLTLTPEGAAYAKQLTTVFEAIDRATRVVRNRAVEKRVHVNVPPTFAARWLVPRLTRFQNDHPEVQIEVSTSSNNDVEDEFDWSNVDLFVRRARYGWDARPSSRLFDEILVPVGSPTLTGRSAPTCLDDFKRYMLLHAQQRPNDWMLWLSAAGATTVDPYGGLRLQHSDLAYQAALRGLGIAMAQAAYVVEELNDGTLILLSDFGLNTCHSYFSLSPVRKSSPDTETFAAWLKSEAELFAVTMHRWEYGKSH